jgi:putative ABC transport system substrate-binding protein
MPAYDLYALSGYLLIPSRVAPQDLQFNPVPADLGQDFYFIRKRRRIMKKLLSLCLCLFIAMAMTGCSSNSKEEDVSGETKTFKVGICNYVDDASLNQICDNITERLQELGRENDVQFNINYDNANADANVMNQIITNFIADKVDLMIGVATPVAMNMQALTEDNQIPVVFAAVSDPLAAGLIDSLDNPGKNITGTSDYLDTEAIINLILALKPGIRKVGLLYDVSQDSSKTAIDQARDLLSTKGIEVIERTGTSVDEIRLAAQSLISEKVEAIFTPSDNTVMTAELSIYEELAKAGIPHFAGADSFALNGAFAGYGVDYANLGRVTAEMVCDILVNGETPATTAVKTFDNGIATINTNVCDMLGFNQDKIIELFSPYCTKVQKLETAEYFE